MRNALITLGIVLAGWFALGVAASASGEDQTAQAFAGMFEGSLWIGGIIIGIMFFREWRKKKNQNPFHQSYPLKQNESTAI